MCLKIALLKLCRVGGVPNWMGDPLRIVVVKNLTSLFSIFFCPVLFLKAY